MDREAEYLLLLLRDFVRHEQPPAPVDVNWDKLLELSDIHSVTGIVSYMATAHKLCADPQMKARMRTTCMSTMSRFGHRGYLTDRFCQKLAENGIDHIRMKGIVLRSYYPVPELRSFGDVDLVIRQEDRTKCHELMLSLGFRAETDWEPIYSYRSEQEFYELHTQLLETDISEKKDLRSYFRDLWQNTVCTGAHRFEFTPEYHFLYMLVHIAKHIHGAGAGIRMYVDVAAFIDHFGQSIDWEWIAGELEQLKLMDFASTVMTAVEHWFGSCPPALFRRVSEDILNDFTEYTMEAGLFGQFSREQAVISLKNKERETKASRFQLLLRRAFPPARIIARRYVYLQKYPWLLPVAWIHRFIITRGDLTAHAHEAEMIFSAEPEQIRRLRQITSRIGL